jgi:hypothetical protein
MNARLAFAAVIIALALPAVAGTAASDQVVRAQTPFKQSPVVRLPALPERAASEATHVPQTPFKQSALIPREYSAARTAQRDTSTADRGLRRQTPFKQSP